MKCNLYKGGKGWEGLFERMIIIWWLLSAIRVASIRTSVDALELIYLDK